MNDIDIDMRLLSDEEAQDAAGGGRAHGQSGILVRKILFKEMRI